MGEKGRVEKGVSKLEWEIREVWESSQDAEGILGEKKYIRGDLLQQLGDCASSAGGVISCLKP